MTATQEQKLAQGRLLSQSPGMLVLGLPGTDYQLHLTVKQEVKPSLAGQVQGRILAKARRVDKVHTGGRYVEPVYGRPRRVQGAVVDKNPQRNSLTVHCGCAIECILTDSRQQTSEFALGDLVSFDVERGAAFEPVEAN
ncbi:MAG: hypothetical protein IT443_00395 [Phycisphaeraceae bacterium]|nr:hypothetical protein [Phycisphaeraceae bacterium]